MKNSVPILTDQEVSKILNDKPKSPYLAMYSSYLGGIIKDTKWMQVPIDDHVVHRGDGVFETMKFFNSKIYGLDEHMARLKRSSSAIELGTQQSFSEIRELVLQTVKASAASEGLIRLYYTRGQGGFTTNPYDCTRTGLYIVITKFKPASPESYVNGVTCKISKYLAKENFYSQIKSCNYLQNVLMKKDAVDSQVDFTIAVDAKGFVAEGSTENCAFISQDSELLIPSFENTLRGITITRVIELAEGLVAKGELKAIKEKKISLEVAFLSREMAFIGTTLDVLPVVKLNQKNIGAGKPGPVFKKLQDLLLKDLNDSNSKMNTAVP